MVPPGETHQAYGKKKADFHLMFLNQAMIGVPTFALGEKFQGEVGVRFAEKTQPWKLSFQTVEPGVISFKWLVLSVAKATDEAHQQAYLQDQWREPTPNESVRLGRSLHIVVERLVQAREALGQIQARIPILVQRLEAVLSFWEQLDTVRYLRFQKYTLNELMFYFYYGVLNMWIGGPRKSMRDSLRAAVDQMRNASEDEIQTRMMRYFHWLINNDPKLQHCEWLKTPGLLERELAITKETDPDFYEGQKTGQWLDAYLSRPEQKKYPKNK